MIRNRFTYRFVSPLHALLRMAIFTSFSVSVGFAIALDCRNAITTPDINECAALELNQVEKRLNQVYQDVIKSLDQRDTETERYSEMKKKMIEAQRAWVRFREADCNSVYLRHAGGTIRTVMYIGCMQNHAERRIKDLQAYERG